jgi:hypothetical protein
MAFCCGEIAVRKREMKRRFLILFALALMLATRSDRPAFREPIPDKPFTIAAMPVDLEPGNPARKSLGKLEWLGGWKLTGSIWQFGGLSGMLVSRGRFTGISDLGAIFEFGIGGTARLRPIPLGCGRRQYKMDQDSELIAQREPDGEVWIALESLNAMCRHDPQVRTTRATTQPIALRNWDDTDGAEAAAWLADGRFALFGEGNVDGKPGIRPLLLFAGDPALPETPVIVAEYRSPKGTRPVDAVTLSDGRVLVLNRSFRFPVQFRAVLVEIDAGQFKPGATVSGREIARFAPPVLTDNYEALAVEETGEGRIVWIASDDNYFPLQRTLLLKFRMKD